MNSNEYLKRIGLTMRDRIDYGFLSAIQKQHMLSVPFENIDIIESRKIELDLQSLYHKIVVNRRGGYCYELNGLLHWVLQELGFSSTMIAGQVASEDGSFGPEFDHMALHLRLNEEYIVDVGFGDSVRTPLPLSGEGVTDISGSYRIARDEADRESLFFQKRNHNGGWIAEYKFTLRPRQLSDFFEMNTYQQTSPQSHFTKKILCSIATEEGRVTLSGDSLVITTRGKKETLPINSLEERDKLLQLYFDIK